MSLNNSGQLVPEEGHILIFQAQSSGVTLLRSLSCERRSWGQILRYLSFMCLPFCFWPGVASASPNKDTILKTVHLASEWSCLNQRSTNSGLWDESSLLPVSENKVLLAHGHNHSFMCWPWLLLPINSRVELLSKRETNTLLALYRESLLTSALNHEVA